ncbi:Cyanovirin-N [Zopfia rhizophila CBS 207.26]|uniref:Cyanovirin-N n=1 Tax=Zopfia rhizophila CBS 207.26 TaxID=1314779 RepID=A0A6A6DAP9_9PEZI|nr:Cyanovirin-N [Zopfia rhizophila CBS 207.26]
MFLSTAIVSFASFGILVDGAPTKAGFSQECTDITLKDDWLVANCPTGEDDTTRIQSSVYLSSKITNSEAYLGWKMDGAYANSCSKCQIINGATLNCMCNHSWNAKENTTLNLEEHISNYNGHLLSDLAGPPSPPSSSSPTPMPADLSWALHYGNVSCYSPTSDRCKDIPFGPGKTCQASPSVTSKTTPSTCFTFRVPIAGEIWENFQSMKATSPGKGYEFVFYDDLQCTGEPISSIKPEELGVCKEFPKLGVGVKVKPLWNADV